MYGRLLGGGGGGGGERMKQGRVDVEDSVRLEGEKADRERENVSLWTRVRSEEVRVSM
jgi:hypothetical protein